jgi:PD-(D/E)XK nuclease superfamily
MVHRSHVARRVPEFGSGDRTPWVVSATDLTFLLDSCPRCFYRKVALRQPRPRAPFPTVFGAIDRAMKEGLLGRRADQLALGAPTGVIGSPDRWVKSAPMMLAGCSTPVILRGRLDALVARDDGSDGVVDFKTALPGDAHVPLYGRQVHAYAWALEHPAGGRAREVSALGLLCFSPGQFEAHGQRAALLGDLRWVGVPRDDVAFERFLTEVVLILEASEPPPPAEGCGWCRWHTMHRDAA